MDKAHVLPLEVLVEAAEIEPEPPTRIVPDCG